MSTSSTRRARRAQELSWLIGSGVWWILIAVVGALALWFLYLYHYWKNVPLVPANILSVEKKKGAHETVTYLVRCEYTDQNGEKRIAVYGVTKEPKGNETQVRINPKHPDRVQGSQIQKTYLMLFWIVFATFVGGCIAGVLH